MGRKKARIQGEEGFVRADVGGTLAIRISLPVLAEVIWEMSS